LANDGMFRIQRLVVCRVICEDAENSVPEYGKDNYANTTLQPKL